MLKTSLIIKTTILLLATAVLALNLIFFHSLITGITLSILWLGVSCILWGSIFAPARERFEQVAFGLVAILVIIILIGTSCFRLAVFNDYVIIAITFFIPLAGIVILFLRTPRQAPAPAKHETHRALVRLPIKNIFPALLILGYLALFAYSIIFILHYRTDVSLRTPWEVLPHSLLYLYAFATFILFSLLFYSTVQKSRLASPTISKPNGHGCPTYVGQSEIESLSEVRHAGANERVGERGWLFALIILHFFLTLSLALLVYRIGYGFDPFIHRAAEKIIFETGTLNPSPFSYLGQYVLVVFLSKITIIPLPLIDLWLLPILASVLIPLTILFTLKNYLQKTNYCHLATLSLLILPPSLFIATIPQSLANLFYLILTLLSLSYLKRHIPLSLLWALGISIVFIHPLTGIPALLFLCYLTVIHHATPHVSRILLILFSIAGAFGIPAAILIANRLYGGIAPLSANTLPLPNLIPHYLPFLSLAHTGELWMRVLPLLFLIGAVSGTYLLLRRKENKYTLALWLTALVLFINYLFIRKLPLTAIIAYERPEFTERILELIGLTLLPLFLIALHNIISFILSFSPTCDEVRTSSEMQPLPDHLEPERARNPNQVGMSEGESLSEASHAGVSKRVRRGCMERLQTIFHPHLFISFLFIASLITISFYYTYPRVDAFAKSRGFSVSQTDIDTAHWINDDSGSEPYVVLSNQSVAAAALQELGFKQYFKLKDCQTADCQTIFYYPIPTSSPLYQYYLNMVYQEASRSTMEKAMDLVGVTRAYFVLNAYWLDADKIAARASLDADRTAAVGSTKVFVYLKK